jgi:hypothetical protein
VFQAWLNQNQGGAASAKAALDWAKHTRDTDINRAVYMDHGGPGGSPAYAFYGKKGGSNIVPLSVMVKNGFAPEVVSQNTAAVLNQSQQITGGPVPAGSPPAAPVQGFQQGGPVIGTSGFLQVAPVQHFQDGGQAQPSPATPDAASAPTPPAGHAQILESMNPDNVAKPDPTLTAKMPQDVTNPIDRLKSDLVTQVQNQANRAPQVLPSGVAIYGGYEGAPINLHNGDGIRDHTGGMIDSQGARQLLWDAIHSNSIDKLPTAPNGDKVLKTFHTNTGDIQLMADMAHPDSNGGPSGLPYIEMRTGPYESQRMVAGGDHWLHYQDSEDEVAERLANITGAPRVINDRLSPQEKADIFANHFRRANLGIPPPEGYGGVDAAHNMLKFASRVQDMADTMDPTEFGIAAKYAMNLNQVAAGVPGAKEALEALHLSPETQAKYRAFENNWYGLKNYIAQSAHISREDANAMLERLGGSPEAGAAFFKDNLRDFIRDYSVHYQQAVRTYNNIGYDMPDLYKADMDNVTRHGRVLDYEWNPAQTWGPAKGQPAQHGQQAQQASQRIAPPENNSQTNPLDWTKLNDAEAKAQGAKYYSNTWVKIMHNGVPTVVQIR